MSKVTIGRSKIFYKMLRRLNNKEGSVFDTHGNLIERGLFRYQNSRLCIQEIRIPISAIRSMDPDFYRRGLVFIDSVYNINRGS